MVFSHHAAKSTTASPITTKNYFGQEYYGQQSYSDGDYRSWLFPIADSASDASVSTGDPPKSVVRKVLVWLREYVTTFATYAVLYVP